MDNNLIFWLYAYCLMFVVLAVGFRGIKLAKSGDFVGHMRAMTFSCNLLLVFVVTYVLKVIFLKREDKSDWELFDFVILYTHEALIFTMLISGTYTRILASKFKGELNAPSPESLVLRKRHAIWGKRAYLACMAAFLTATGVLWVLFRHAK